MSPLGFLFENAAREQPTQKIPEARSVKPKSAPNPVEQAPSQSHTHGACTAPLSKPVTAAQWCFRQAPGRLEFPQHMAPASGLSRWANFSDKMVAESFIDDHQR